MEALHLYFSKPEWGKLPAGAESRESMLEHLIALDQWDGNWDEVDMVVLGIADGCNSPGNEACAHAPDAIRKALLQLAPLTQVTRVLDLGNILGKQYRDRVFALREVVAFLSTKRVLTVVLGGSQDYTAVLCDALAETQPEVNLALIDSRIDWEDAPGDYTSSGYLSALVGSGTTAFHQLTLLGTQRYLNSLVNEYACKGNNFEILRLGNMRGTDVASCEPYLRDADVVSMDASAIQSSDMPAQRGAMPNGVWAHDACQLARYAGLSDRLKVWGLFEVNPAHDLPNGAGVMLAAQLVWHVLEGSGERHHDFPERPLDDYERFVVLLDELDVEIFFYHNPMNDRWWVKIPSEAADRVVSCSRADYLKALDKDFPERWFRGLILRS